MKYLIVVDMQNDFVTGPLGTPEAVAIVDRIKEKIETGDFKNIIFTRDTHDKKYLQTPEGKKLPVKHCIKETPGWCIVDTLRETVDKIDSLIPYYLNKNTFGTLEWNRREIGIPDYHGIEIEIVGVCTDICVISNALILKTFYPYVNIIVDASCCAGTTPEMHQKALDVMKSCQIEIINEKNI